MYFGKLIEDVTRIKKETRKLYIYGAGFYGKDICRTLKNNGIQVDGFLVTNEHANQTVLDLPVLAAEAVLQETVGIVIGLSDTYVGEVLDYLETSGMDMSHVVNGGKYITDTGGREDLRGSKVLEVGSKV